MFPKVVNSLVCKGSRGCLFRWVQTRPKLWPMASTHAHDLAMLRSSDAHQLSREWEALTGDSFIVDVRPMYERKLTDFLKRSNTLWSFQTLNCRTICMLTKRLRQTLYKQFWCIERCRSTRRINRRRPRRWLALHADALHLPKRVRLQFFEQWTEDLSWNITSKAPKATGLHRATAIPKPKRSLCFHSRPNVAVLLSIWTAARSSDSP